MSSNFASIVTNFDNQTLITDDDILYGSLLKPLAAGETETIVLQVPSRGAYLF